MGTVAMCGALASILLEGFTLANGTPRLSVAAVFVAVLAAGVACLLIGFAGLAVEMYRTAMSIAAQTGDSLAYIVQWGISCAAMLMVAHLAAIAAGVAWFFLDSRVGRIEAAETAWLYEN